MSFFGYSLKKYLILLTDIYLHYVLAHNQKELVSLQESNDSTTLFNIFIFHKVFLNRSIHGLGSLTSHLVPKILKILPLYQILPPKIESLISFIHPERGQHIGKKTYL